MMGDTIFRDTFTRFIDSKLLQTMGDLFLIKFVTQSRAKTNRHFYRALRKIQFVK